MSELNDLDKEIDAMQRKATKLAQKIIALGNEVNKIKGANKMIIQQAKQETNIDKERLLHERVRNNRDMLGDIYQEMERCAKELAQLEEKINKSIEHWNRLASGQKYA